ncbi:MAG: cytochrome c1 [Paracoccaceae bacterium]
MIKKLTLSAVAALGLMAGAAQAAGDAAPIDDVNFTFEGPFGTYNQFQLQRGLQVYTEVCAACHGLKQVPLRTLADSDGVGLPEDQVRAYAARTFRVFDAELQAERPATPNDYFPDSMIENAPDLSLMAKSRAGFSGPYGTGINQFFKGMGGPEYISAILTSYTGVQMEQAGTVLYENTAFPGGWISMAPPLTAQAVEYADGHPTTLQAHAQDVSAFLMWAAEPKMMARKQTGFLAVTFLVLLTVLLYLTNKRLWAPHKARNRVE